MTERSSSAMGIKQSVESEGLGFKDHILEADCQWSKDFIDSKLLDTKISRDGLIHSDGLVAGFDGTCLEGQAWMVLQAKYPFHIMQVSQNWCDISGYAEGEAVGRSFKFLQGPGTDQSAISRMLEKVRKGDEYSITVTTYMKGCKPLVTCFEAIPLLDEDKQISRFLAKVFFSQTISSKDELDGEGAWILLSGESKHKIIKSSPELTAMTGFQEQLLSSRSLRVLLGPSSNEVALHDELSACVGGKGGDRKALLTIYSSEGKPIVCESDYQAVLDPKEGTVARIKICLRRAELQTVEQATQDPGDAAKVVMLAKPPHLITHASKPWCDAFEFSSEDVVGKSIQMFQGKCTDTTVLSATLERCGLSCAPQRARLIVYRKSGAPMVTTMALSPLLSASGSIEHFDAIFAVVDACDARREQPAGAVVPAAEYPSTPAGRITHLNGCTHLVMFPREDPTLQHCLRYMRHLRDAGVVQSWSWHEDALHVHVDTNRVLEYTHTSRWCQQWTPDLRTWHAWWNRMLWVVSEASMTLDGSDSDPEDDDGAASDLSFLAEAGAGGFAFARARPVSPAGDGGAAAWRAAAPQIGAALDSESIDVPVCLLNEQGTIVFAGAAMVEQLGCGAADLEGRYVSALGAEGSAAAVAELGRAIQQREQATLRLPVARGDGTEFESLVWLSPCAVAGAGCFSLTLVNCGDLFEEDQPHVEELSAEEELAALEDEVYRQCVKEELYLMQQRTASKIAATLERISIAPAPPAAGGAKRPAPRFAELALPLDRSNAVLLRCGEQLRQLRRRGVVRQWCWDTDSLSVRVDLAALRGYASESAWRDLQTWSGGSQQQLLVRILACMRLHEGEGEGGGFGAAAAAARSVEALEGEVAALKEKVEGMQGRHRAALREMSEGRTALEQEVAKLRRELAAASAPPPPPASDCVEVGELESAVVERERQAQLSRASRQEMGDLVREQVAALNRELEAIASPLAGAEQCASAPAQGEAAAAVGYTELAAAVGSLTAGQESLAGQAAVLEGRAEALDGAVAALRQELAALALAPADGAGAAACAAAELDADDEPALVAALLAAFERRVLEAAADASLALLDGGGAILWASPALLAAVGFRSDEVVGCGWTSFLCGPETDPAAVARLADGRARGAAVSLCLQCYHERGHALWLQVGQQPADWRGGGGGPPALLLLSALDATALFGRVVRLGRPMDPARDPALFAESQRLSALQARALRCGEWALCAAADECLAGPRAGLRESPAPAPACAAPAAASGGRAAEEEGGQASAVVSAREPWVVLEVSPAWERLFGFAGHEAWGRSVAVVLGGGGAGFAAFGGAAAAAAAGRRAEAALGVASQTRGGARFAADVTVAPAAGEAGKPLAALTQLAVVWRPAAAAAAAPGRT